MATMPPLHVLTPDFHAALAHYAANVAPTAAPALSFNIGDTAGATACLVMAGIFDYLGVGKASVKDRICAGFVFAGVSNMAWSTYVHDMVANMVSGLHTFAAPDVILNGIGLVTLLMNIGAICPKGRPAWLGRVTNLTYSDPNTATRMNPRVWVLPAAAAAFPVGAGIGHPLYEALASGVTGLFGAFAHAALVAR